MKIEKIRELSNEELVARSRELKKEMLNLRIQKTLGQLENRNAIKFLRKDNARLMTVLGERRLGINAGLGASGPAASAKETAPAAARTASADTPKPAAEKAPAKRKSAAAPAKKAARKTASKKTTARKP
jgi:large subunit ribosomal protein L29